MKAGVIGRGWIAEKWMDGARSHGIEIEAVCSRSLEDARAFARKHGIPLALEGVEELAACDAIDSVYIASPNYCHAPQAIALLNAGKHVTAEKPLAINSAQVRAMFDAARANGRVLLEAQRGINNPAYGRVRQAMSKLGVIRRCDFIFDQYSSKYDAFKGGELPNTFNPALGNGALMDIGVYCVAFMAGLFGRPKEIRASAVFLEHGWDAVGCATCVYEGMLVSLHYSKVSEGRAPSLIEGEKGTLLIGHVAEPYDLRIIYRDGSVEDLSAPREKNDMHHEALAFLEMTEGRRDSRPMEELSVLTMEIMDAIRKDAGIVYPGE